MIQLKTMDSSEYKPHTKDLQISHIVPLHRMPIKDYFPQYTPENVLASNSLLQLFAAFWAGNGSPYGHSVNILFHKAPKLSLFLCDETILALPSLFDKVFVLHTNPTTVIGFDVTGIKEDTYKALLKLRAENCIDPYLNDVFTFYTQEKPSVYPARFFRVESEVKPEIPSHFLKNALLQYVLKQCLAMGEWMIPITGFTEEEIISKAWLNDLLGLFERVLVLTTNEASWTTQGILVSNIRKPVLKLMSEIEVQSFGSLGVIGGKTVQE
jgi:hypothetical protein